MIKVIFHKENKNLKTIEVTGHAGYADNGKDIVCSAVSAILIGGLNALNNCDKYEIIIKDGYVYFNSNNELSEHDQIVLETILIQLKTISESYPKFISICDNWERTNKMMLRFKLDLQLFASHKGVGSTKNGRDSAGRRLGAKRSDGQFCKAGAIIYRQRGTKIFPGVNTKLGKDDTIFATKKVLLNSKELAKIENVSVFTK